MARNHYLAYYLLPIFLIIFAGCSFSSSTQSTTPKGEGGDSENQLGSSTPILASQEDMLTSLLKGTLDPGPITGQNANRLLNLGFFLRGPATDVAFSDDGQWLAVCSEYSGLALYDINSQEEKWFTEDAIGCQKVKISSNSNLVATNNWIWNIETGLELEFSESVASNSFWFSPDSKSIIIYREDMDVTGFKEFSVNEQAGLTLYYSEWQYGQFSPDGHLFATTLENPDNPSQLGIQLITFPQGEKIEFIPDRGDHSFSKDWTQFIDFNYSDSSLEFWGLDGKLNNKIQLDSKDSPELVNENYAIYHNENSIVILDVATQSQIYSYEFSRFAPFLPAQTDFFLSPKNNYLAISDEKGLQVVEIKTGKQILQIDKYSPEGDGDIYFSSDKQQMIVANYGLNIDFGPDGSFAKIQPLTHVGIWDMHTRKIIKEIILEGVSLDSPCSLILGSAFFTHLGQNRTWNDYLDAKGDLWHYDLGTQKTELRMPNTPRINNQLVLSSSGKLIWIPSELPGAEIIPAGDWYILSPDGKMLAIFKESSLLLWDVNDQKAITDIGFNETIIQALFSKNDKSLILISEENIWRLDTETPDQFREISDYIAYWTYESVAMSSCARSLDIAPDGSVLAVSDNQHGVYMIPFDGEFANTSISYGRPGATHYYRTVAFSEDGRLLATGTREGTIELFMVNPQPSPTPFPANTINIEVVSPADNSITENLFPEISVNIPNLPEGGDVTLFIEGDNMSNSTSFSTHPDEKEYIYETATINLEPGKTYTWSVEVSFPDQSLITSGEYTFTTPSNVEILPKPILISPENGSAQAQPADGWITLEWQPVEGAVDYTVCIFEAYNDSGSGNEVCSEEVQGTSDYAKVELNLTNGHHYEWYVIARGLYAESEQSETWTFTTK